LGTLLQISAAPGSRDEPENAQTDNKQLMAQLVLLQQANISNQAMFAQFGAQLKDLQAANERLQKERDEQNKRLNAALASTPGPQRESFRWENLLVPVLNLATKACTVS